MLKLITSSRIWRRWEMRVAINYGMLSIGRAIIMVLVFGHWCVCNACNGM